VTQFYLLALQFFLCILAKCKLGQFCSFKSVYSGVAKKKCVFIMTYFAFCFLGPLSDIIQLLLTALFSMQEEEDDEILETDNQTSGVC